MENKILVKLKWKILRYLVKRDQISCNKMMIRMHQIQCLEKLDDYERKILARFSYRKVRKIFITEFPNKYLHNPNESILNN